MKDHTAHVIHLDGGTQAVIEENGRTNLTSYNGYAREIPRIYLSPKDALYLAHSILRYINPEESYDSF
jgi:hypothetical protein